MTEQAYYEGGFVRTPLDTEKHSSGAEWIRHDCLFCGAYVNTECVRCGALIMSMIPGNDAFNRCGDICFECELLMSTEIL